MNTLISEIQYPKATILVVDDDKALSKSLCQLLNELGYNTVQSSEGRNAVQLFTQHKPDLVLLDLLMPYMDGYETCQNIRRICIESIEAMPIVIMTSHDDSLSVEQAFSAGATDFISKPINLNLFPQRIAYILKNSRNYKELQNKQEQLDHAQRIARMGSWQIELPSKRVSISKQCAYILGMNHTHGCFKLDEMMQLVHPDDKDNVKNAIENAILTRGSYSLEHRIVLPDEFAINVIHQGEFVPATRIKDNDYLLGTIQDITELRQAQSEAEYRRYFDTTTNLPNRHSFEMQLEHVTQDSNTHTLTAVVLLALDHFSKLNESIGHGGGDRILNIFADRLRSLEGSGHYVSHFSGDRFALLLHHIHHVDACEAALNDILELIRTPVSLNGNQHHLTASIGSTLFPIDGENASDLIQWAESAVQQAKNNGGDRFAFHSAEREKRTQRRLSMEQAMRKGIERDEFEVFYQPQVSAEAGIIIGMEALVRWRHPQQGMISPAEFIPLAEDTGLIVPIGEKVLEQACQDTRHWLDQGHLLVVGVNLSALQFSHKNLIQKVQDTLQSCGLPSTSLELEVTESMAMQDFDESIKKLQDLQALGCKTSLDDFGTGYSSLSYLQHMPLSTLKVDQSFVRCIECSNTEIDAGNCTTGAIAATIINLSQNLNLHVIVEGVETQQQFHFLRQYGDLTLQGFYFGKPMPHADFDRQLSEQQLSANKKMIHKK